MDPEYYERQADTQDKKATSELRRRSDYEAEAARLDARALSDETAAARATSASTARSKLRSAESHRNRAVDRRRRAAAAGAVAAKAQLAANQLRQKANAERARRAKADAQRAAREARDAERRARQEQRRRDNLDRTFSAGINALDAKTDDLAAAIATSRQQAPSQITVLFMAGTPEGGTDGLRLDREAREIDAKVRSGRARDQIAMQWTQATRIRDIIDALNRYEPDVVHFSGHGDQSSLLFEGDDGTPQALSGDQLGLLLQTAPRPIRLLVFNACESAVQAEASTDWSHFAIGMERPIDDDAAKEWAGQFYGSLAAGATLDRAFQQATAHATVLTSESAAGSPQLFSQPAQDAAATVLVTPDLSGA